MKKLIATAIAALAVTTWGGVADNVSSGPVTPNVWNSDFRAGKAYADEHGLPLILIYASEGCSYCRTLEKAVDKDVVQAWINSHKVVLVFKEGTATALKAARSKDGATSAYPDFYAARQWLKSANESLTGYPFVGLYRSTSKPRAVAFTGRSETIPNYAGSGSGLAERFAAVLDRVFGDDNGTPVDPKEEDTPEPEEKEEDLPDSDFGQVAATHYAGLYGKAGMEAAITVTTGIANNSGRVKVSGTVVTLTGAKKTFTAYCNVKDAAISVRVTGLGQLELKFGQEGMYGTLDDLVVALCDSVGGPLAKSPSFVELSEDFPEAVDGVQILTEFLPTNTPITTVGTKWATEKATGSVKWDKTAGEVVATGTNPSKLKLTYNAKTGIFKGSFYVYAPVYKYAKGDCEECGEGGDTPIGATVRKTSASVTGFVLNGTGVGMVKINKVGTFAFKIR